jgi:nonsense-mediated mRNA decay protein 3
MFLFLDKNRIPIDMDDTDEEGIPQISLQEMLDDLHIADDATGGEGAAMID